MAQNDGPQNTIDMNPYSKDFYNDTYITGTSTSADVVVNAVWSIIQPKSVVDVGCGVGLFLEAFSSRGVKELCGIDGAWVTPDQLHIKREQFIAHDLKEPIHLGRHFDLVICLEVAEHLPPEAAPTLVKSLVELGPVVLFSAAVPQQGGVSHLNEQWPDYWAALFAKRGYQAVDCIRKRIWGDEKVFWWYSQNTILFVNMVFLEKEDKLRSEFEQLAGTPLSIIHPRAFLHYRKSENPTKIPFRALLALGKRWAMQRYKAVVKAMMPRDGK